MYIYIYIIVISFQLYDNVALNLSPHRNIIKVLRLLFGSNILSLFVIYCINFFHNFFFFFIVHDNKNIPFHCLHYHTRISIHVEISLGWCLIRIIRINTAWQFRTFRNTFRVV